MFGTLLYYFIVMSNTSPSPHHRLRRLKAALLAVSFTLAGILLMMLNAWVTPMRLGDWQWLHALPLGELGGTLFGAGLLSTFFEYTFRRDQEAHTMARFRQIIREEAPAMRDAVVEGFAIHPDDLKRVATPELLDDIAANVMALRLGDEQFAREIYRDIRDQAIRAAERWYDVAVRVRLSTAVERSTAGLLCSTSPWSGSIPPCPAVLPAASLVCLTRMSTTNYSPIRRPRQHGFSRTVQALTQPAGPPMSSSS